MQHTFLRNFVYEILIFALKIQFIYSLVYWHGCECIGNIFWQKKKRRKLDSIDACAYFYICLYRFSNEYNSKI